MAAQTRSTTGLPKGARVRIWMAVLVALVLVMLTSVSAHASHDVTANCGSSHPDWWGTDGICHKYGEVKRVFSGGTLREVWWRGGTASGSCDPTNDVVKWRLESVYVIRVGDGRLRWQYGPGGYHSNCNVHGTNYVRSPNLAINVDHHVFYDFRHVLQSGSSFFPRAGFYIDL